MGFLPGHTSFAYFFFRGSIASVSERGGGVVGETLPGIPTGEVWTLPDEERYGGKGSKGRGMEGEMRDGI